MSLSELLTALKAARYQLSRTRLHSPHRAGLILCITFYEQQLLLLEQKEAA